MKPTATVFAALALVIAAQAWSADTPAAPICNSGAKTGWQSVTKLKQYLTKQSMAVSQVKVVGDCYAVYAVTHLGQPANAYYHPVTLKVVAPIPD